MKKSLNPFFLKNSFLILLSFVYLPIVIALSLLNNDYLNLVTASHIDSGSILQSIFELFDQSKISNFYNQNVPYHTVYGYTYNSLLFFVFGFSKKVLGLNAITDFYFFALIARLLNVIIGSLILISTNKIVTELKFRRSIVFVILVVNIIFTPFIYYSFLIKPDLLGLLFQQFSLILLYLYTSKKEGKLLIVSLVFTALSIMSKQSYLFLVIPHLYYLFLLRKEPKKLVMILGRSILIALILLFLIHPYAILDFPGLIRKQQVLIQGNLSSEPLQNLYGWSKELIDNPFIVFIILTPFVTTVLWSKKNIKCIGVNPTFFLLISIYCAVYNLWVLIKVGPIYELAYFLPTFFLSTILLAVLIDSFYRASHKHSNLRQSLLKFAVYALFILVVISMARRSFSAIYNYAYFKNGYQYKVAENINNKLSKYNHNSIVIHTATIPIRETKNINALNTWQFSEPNQLILTKPIMILIDQEQSWEKSPRYYEAIAHKIGLKISRMFKKVILYY